MSIHTDDEENRATYNALLNRRQEAEKVQLQIDELASKLAELDFTKNEEDIEVLEYLLDEKRYELQELEEKIAEYESEIDIH